jgi:tripartite-type tricarboxylate transporter receptor subunit TctC
MSMKKRLLGCFVLLIALTFLSPFSGQAGAAYPEKPITMIIPQSAGGGTDGIARAIASRLEKALGVPVVVSNEDGAGGRRASIVLFKSQPDGYTIGMPHFAALLYDEVLGDTPPPIEYKKFAVLMRADTTIFFIHVNKKSPFKTLQDFKTAGKPIRFASSGVGTPSWLQPAALSAYMGFRPVFVTGHKSLSEAALAVARGDLDAATGSYTHFQGVLEDVRPLVYMSDQRSHLLPEVPTIVEAGYPKLASMGVPWVFAAPPGTPAGIMNTLRTAMTKITSSEEFVTWAQKQGYNPSSQGPEGFWKSFADMEEVYKSIKPLMAEKK